MAFCDARQMTAPVAYIKFTPETFAGDGRSPTSRPVSFLSDFMAEFREHVVRVLTVLPRERT